MEYQEKLRKILQRVDSKQVPYPTHFSKKKINYLSNANAVSFIRSVLQGSEREKALELLAHEKPVKRLLSKYSEDECAFFIASIPK